MSSSVKRKQRGLKCSLENREQRVRQSRHNAPHTRRVWTRRMVMVSPGTPGSTRTVEKLDPGTAYPAGTVVIDDTVVVHRKPLDVSRQVPVTEPFKRLVAAGPTATYGQENKPENMAPRGKGGSKPAPGGRK